MPTLAGLHNQLVTYARNAVIIRRYVWSYNDTNATCLLGTSLAVSGDDDNETGVVGEYVDADIAAELIPFLATQYDDAPAQLTTYQEWLDWLRLVGKTQTRVLHLDIDYVNFSGFDQWTFVNGGIAFQITDLPDNNTANAVFSYATTGS